MVELYATFWVMYLELKRRTVVEAAGKRKKQSFKDGGVSGSPSPPH